ncbi:MAG: Fic family protein [Candidatus Riflebacteria bacterium]|nr:Fic family protein [Candidatus Riflebacteria bacterium]
MRDYAFEKKWKKLLTPEIIALLTKIHEYRGRQNLYVESKPAVLTRLVETAKVQSTEASNRIEGIYTSAARLKQLVKEKTTPKNRDESEIAGYRDVLNSIHESHDHIPLKPNTILQLHRDLYKFEGYDIGGKYKSADNAIEEEDSEGNKFVRFKPVPAWETPESIQNLCEAFERSMGEGVINPLLLIPMFIIDFLCIHPFTDGNGRMSRLLTLLLLYKSGYVVGKYISIEKMIEKTKESYYECLLTSSQKWKENENDYIPFVKYMLGIIVASYRDFFSRADILVNSGLSKPGRIRELIKGTYGEITKSEIMEKCPDISHITVQRALTDMLEKKEIIKLGGGRYTKYIWNR